MKAAGIVILVPLMSVLIVSLHMAGGASRTAARALLAISAIALLTGLVKRSGSRPEG